VIYDNRDVSGLRIDPVDVTLLLFWLGLKPLVKAADPGARAIVAWAAACSEGHPDTGGSG
jgi:hypothetical protein